MILDLRRLEDWLDWLENHPAEAKPMGQSGYVHLEDCEVLKLTDQAVLVRWEGQAYWLPRSQVADPDPLEAGDEGVTVGITEWIARQKGIETEE